MPGSFFFFFLFYALDYVDLSCHPRSEQDWGLWRYLQGRLWHNQYHLCMDPVSHSGQAISPTQPRQPDLTRSIGMLTTTPHAHALERGAVRSVRISIWQFTWAPIRVDMSTRVIFSWSITAAYLGKSLGVWLNAVICVSIVAITQNCGTTTLRILSRFETCSHNSVRGVDGIDNVLRGL
jgi:hypothetical protein